MHLKTPDDLQTLLRAGEDYSTPTTPRRGLADRLFGKLDAWYYLRLTGIVIRAYRKAKAGRYDNHAWAWSSFSTLRLVEGCGGRVRIDGAARLKEIRGPAVFIANHMSLLETFLLPCILLSFNERGIVTVVKQSLLDYPFFGKVLHTTRPIAVGRQSPRDDLVRVIEEGTKGLREGRTALVFPQSTRKASIAEDDFNSIGVKLARRASMPAVPVALKTDFQGIGGFLRDFGSITRSSEVRFEFGDPLTVQGSGREEHDQAVRFIVGKVTSWRNPERT